MSSCVKLETVQFIINCLTPVIPGSPGHGWGFGPAVVNMYWVAVLIYPRDGTLHKIPGQVQEIIIKLVPTYDRPTDRSPSSIGKWGIIEPALLKCIDRGIGCVRFLVTDDGLKTVCSLTEQDMTNISSWFPTLARRGLIRF